MQPLQAFYLVIIEEYSNNDIVRLRATAVVINLGRTGKKKKKKVVTCGVWLWGEGDFNILIELLRRYSKPNKSEFLGVRFRYSYKHPL